MNKRRMGSNTFALHLGVALCLFLAGIARSAEYRWKGPSGDDWPTAGNWEVWDGSAWVATQDIPGEDDIFRGASAYAVRSIRTIGDIYLAGIRMDDQSSTVVINRRQQDPTLYVSGDFEVLADENLFELRDRDDLNVSGGLTIRGDGTVRFSRSQDNPNSNVTISGDVLIEAAKEGDSPELQMNVANAQLGVVTIHDGRFLVWNNTQDLETRITGGVTIAGLAGTGGVVRPRTSASTLDDREHRGYIDIAGDNGTHAFSGIFSDGQTTDLNAKLEIRKTGANTQIFDRSSGYATVATRSSAAGACWWRILPAAASVAERRSSRTAARWAVQASSQCRI